MDSWLNWKYADFWTQKEARNKRPRPAGLSCWWEVCGKSHGYWTEIRRTKAESEAERRQTTKFGPHWAVDKVERPLGRAYTTRQSPYDPESGVGIWKGRTAPPPRIGTAAPKRWPAEAPDGLRPYEYKQALALASRVVTDRLRLSNDRCNYRRLRDLKQHILERRRHSGSLFRDRDRPTAAQFARGVRWAELESIELYRRHDQLRWFLDAKVDDHKLDFSAHAFAHHSVDGETGIITRNSDAVVGEGIDSNIADQAGFKFEEVDNTVECRRRHPPRERRKAGRKPLGERAMTTAERVARHRARQKQIKAPATHGRLPAGTVQPLPLGLAVPVPTFASTDDSLPRSFLDHGAAMSEIGVGPFLLPGSLREWREVCSGPEVAPPLAPLVCVDGGEIPDFLPARELREAA